MSPNIRNNNCRVERWANCVSCGPITVNKEKADKEIIMLSCSILLSIKNLDKLKNTVWLKWNEQKHYLNFMIFLSA